MVEGISKPNVREHKEGQPEGKILVLGGSGLVGSRFTDLYHLESLLVTPKSEELDITNKKALEVYFETHKNEFSSLANFAAWTDVDGAEKQRGDEKGDVWQINVIGAQNLAETASQFDKFLIHVSTDFIFPGTADNRGPYSEDAPLPSKPDGISWYGWTKLVGERRVKDVLPSSAIVRLSYPFRAHFPRKLDFARTILNLYDEKKLYPMFADQEFTPTFIDDACKVFYLLLEEKTPGIFHAVCQEVTTPFEFASYLLEKARGVRGVVQEGSMQEFLKKPGRTPRPRLGGLSNEKTRRDLGIDLMTWKEGIDELARQLG
jgi:dTDP-4-dehydrorhamnose reductase